MESSVWDVVKALGPYFLTLFAAFASLVTWLHKKQESRVGDLENRVSNVEKSTAVIQVMVDNIKDDIKEIKDGIKELTSRK